MSYFEVSVESRVDHCVVVPAAAVNYCHKLANSMSNRTIRRVCIKKSSDKGFFLSVPSLSFKSDVKKSLHRQAHMYLVDE